MLADSQAAAHVGSWEAIIDDDDGGPPHLGLVRRDVSHLRVRARRSRGRPRPLLRGGPSRRSRAHGAHRKARRGAERPLEVEFRIVRPDGTVRTIQSWFRAERDAAGRPTRLHGTCQDITERKRAETEIRRAREQLQVVVDTTPALIARYDRDLRLVWANKTTPPASASGPRTRGEAPRDIVGEEAFAPSNRRRRACSRARRSRSRSRSPTRGWARARCTSSSSPTFDAGGSRGRLRRGASPTTPTTASSSSERERALEELQEADRRKDEFLAMLAHELRNPLAPILNAVEILAPRARQTPSRGQRPRGHRAAGQAHKRLLDDLLDVSRVSQGKIALQPRADRPRTVLQQAVEVSRPLMAEKTAAAVAHDTRAAQSWSTPIRRASSRSSATCSTTPRSTPSPAAHRGRARRRGRRGGRARARPRRRHDA